MKTYVLTSRANTDLDEIWNYIAQDSVQAADRVEQDLHDAMLKLADMPGMGHTRADVKDPRYRFWNVHSYLIVYRPETNPLQVIRVVSGYRDLSRLFS